MTTPELIVQNLEQRLKKALDQKAHSKLNAIIESVIDYLVAEVSSPALASAILKACAAAARSVDDPDVSLSTTISDGGMFSENSPLYRLCLRTDIKDKISLEILSIIIKYAVLDLPFANHTLKVDVIRRACMVQDNQPLFEYIRSLPEYRDAKPYHEVYLTKPDMQYIDQVEVQPRIIPAGRPFTSNSDIQNSHHQASFTAQFSIPMFQSRMRAMGEVTVEFIAQGRMWALTFCKSTDDSTPLRKGRFPWRRESRAATGISASSWEVKLCLRDNSDPTPVQANLAFSPCRRATSDASPGEQPPTLLEMDKGLGYFDLDLHTRPGCQLRCEPGLRFIRRGDSSSEKYMQEEVCRSLDNGVLGSSIYIKEDGMLVGTLEAILAMTVRRKPWELKKKQKPVDVARKAQETDSLASVCR
ncbi:hypothetical protein F5878DRAFT_59413 [Lentinula raphanica]|uniref:Uncharacterized protein n=1 Tax=Lentinula raphanica TaxID=153919 RepID=A0AA38NW11_9AGAR|nr:hypothetical protein F5878DRAFT_59413 [Lentinula raphanica]